MKQKIEITLNDDHQLYDILNKTYLMGRSREGLEGYSPELISAIKASEDDEDLNQIKRSCMNAVSTLKSYLAEYIKDGTDEADNVLEYGEVKLTLYMPSNFNTAVTASIAAMCHKYVTGMACYDWFVLTNPKEAETYKSMSVEAYTELRQTISKRKRPVPPRGFGDYPAE